VSEDVSGLLEGGPRLAKSCAEPPQLGSLVGLGATTGVGVWSEDAAGTEFVEAEVCRDAASPITLVLTLLVSGRGTVGVGVGCSACELSPLGGGAGKGAACCVACPCAPSIL
jgi:hypothetical protein